MPDLQEHLATNRVEAHMFATQWFFTLYTAKFPLPLVFQFMDMYLCDRTPAMFQAALALLKVACTDLHHPCVCVLWCVWCVVCCVWGVGCVVCCVWCVWCVYCGVCGVCAVCAVCCVCCVLCAVCGVCGVCCVYFMLLGFSCRLLAKIYSLWTLRTF